MIIETYWEDVEIYNVIFYVERESGEIIKLNRILVFEVGLTECDVKEVIKNKFKNVRSIKSVELFDDYALKML